MSDTDKRRLAIISQRAFLEDMVSTTKFFVDVTSDVLGLGDKNSGDERIDWETYLRGKLTVEDYKSFVYVYHYPTDSGIQYAKDKNKNYQDIIKSALGEKSVQNDSNLNFPHKIGCTAKLGLKRITEQLHDVRSGPTFWTKPPKVDIIILTPEPHELERAIHLPLKRWKRRVGSDADSEPSPGFEWFWTNTVDLTNSLKSRQDIYGNIVELRNDYFIDDVRSEVVNSSMTN